MGHWSVSWRLVSVIVLAIVMGLVFGGLRVASAVSTASQDARTTQLAILGEHVTDLAQAMENERDLSAGYVAEEDVAVSAAARAASRPDAATRAAAQRASADKNHGLAQMTDSYRATNAAAETVASLTAQIGPAFPAGIRTSAQQVQQAAGNMQGLRSEIPATSDPLEVIQFYETPIATLFTLNDEIAEDSGDSVLADRVRTLGTLSLAKDEASQQRAILYAALILGSFSAVDTNAYQSLLTAQVVQLEDTVQFEAFATPAQQTSFLNTVNSLDTAQAQLMDEYISEVDAPIAPEIDRIGFSMTAAPADWYRQVSATINGMRSVEEQIVDSIVARSQSLQSGARQLAITTAALTALALLVVLIATLLFARSLVLPLRRLRAGALEVAALRLPERVRMLGENPDAGDDLRVAPINVLSTDEIGEVARAFDQVHAEAVRLAGNEAVLRGGLNAMFVSLSRRSMSLLDRLARMIDSLEQNEPDPDRLSSLFSMDHLVTRMRRHSENLLVLAGYEPVRKRTEPVPLADVARAAASEIEQYGRVMLNVQPGMAVSGPASTDVVHLLAEIIENATLFSPKDTDVHITCREVGGGALIEVHDIGVGISETRMAELNWRLDHPPVIDVSASRHMGLLAVSRLAARHGIRVRLRSAPPRGVTALVWLPGTIVVLQPVGYGTPAPRFDPDAGYRIGGAGPRESIGNGRESIADGRESIGDGRESIRERRESMGNQGGSARSGWFRAKRPSAGVPRQPGNDSPPLGTSLSPAPGTGLSSALLAQPRPDDPADGPRTTAGLPQRTPRTIRQTGPMPAATSAPGLPRRSAEGARERLRGFQRGARRAEMGTDTTEQGAAR